MYTQDEAAAAKSKMFALPVICNGETNGIKCKHYWSFAAKTDALNAEFLKLGEKFRQCTNSPYLVEFDGWESLPHTCDRYDPDGNFVYNFVFKVKRFLLGRKIDKGFENYDPMTRAEVDELSKIANDEAKAQGKVDYGVGKGIPGQTAMASSEQLKESLKHTQVVMEGKITVDELLAQMLPNVSEDGNVLVPITKKKHGTKKSNKLASAKNEPKSDSDGGIFGNNGSDQ